MTTFHSQLIIYIVITIIPCFAMNLKLEDLSQYIVLIIFVLIIIKVLGDGVVGSIYELLTGKKKQDDFDIDTMINRKKSQLNLSPETAVNISKDQSLKEKVKLLKDPNESELLELLQSLEWGDIKLSYAPTSVKLLKEHSNTKGLGRISKFFFSLSLQEKKQNLLNDWKVIYENTILWTNLINNSESQHEKKALVSFKDLNITQVTKMNDQLIHQELESLLDPTTINIIKFKDKPFYHVSPTEIFEQYSEKVNLFKSLSPIVPINKESSNKWAEEVLGLISGEYSDEVIKKQYKELTSKIHPDKYNSLNLNQEQVSILNSNLALVNKAYTLLKK